VAVEFKGGLELKRTLYLILVIVVTIVLSMNSAFATGNSSDGYFTIALINAGRNSLIDSYEDVFSGFSSDELEELKQKASFRFFASPNEMNSFQTMYISDFEETIGIVSENGEIKNLTLITSYGYPCSDPTNYEEVILFFGIMSFLNTGYMQIGKTTDSFPYDDFIRDLELKPQFSYELGNVSLMYTKMDDIHSVYGFKAL